MYSIRQIQLVLGKGNVRVVQLAWQEDPANQLLMRFVNDESDEYGILFSEVTNFEMRSGPYLRFRLVGFVVEDISSYQMEGKHLRCASEDDESYLSFYCKDAALVEQR